MNQSVNMTRDSERALFMLRKSAPTSGAPRTWVHGELRGELQSFWLPWGLLPSGVGVGVRAVVEGAPLLL